MRDLDELFTSLARSKFRSRFRLHKPDSEYLRRKSLSTIIQHGREFILQRLAPAEPENDGKQTPMRGHPMFVAQHATATCCRSCLQKWHNIDKGRTLTSQEMDYVVKVLQYWLDTQKTSMSQPVNSSTGFRQKTLFESQESSETT